MSTDRNGDGTVDLSGQHVTDDVAMEKVIAAQAKVNALKREVSALRKDRELLLAEYTDIQNARSVPKNPESARTKATADKVRVSFGDMHGMRMDRAAMDALVRDLKVLDPDEIVLGGDMAECGGWLAKHQPIGFIALLDYSYQEDVAATNWALDAIQKAAPNATIDYAEGQHEDRVERWIVDQVTANARDAEFLRSLCSLQTLLRLEDRGIKYYRRTEVYGEGLPRGWFKKDNMHFVHELGTSKNAARAAVSDAAGNVTYFHTHRRDTSVRVFPGVGMCEASNPGCLCVMQPVWQNSNVTDWSQGYQIEFISKGGNYLVVHVPIWKGKSLAGAMVERFKS